MARSRTSSRGTPSRGFPGAGSCSPLRNPPRLGEGIGPVSSVRAQRTGPLPFRVEEPGPSAPHTDHAELSEALNQK